MERVVRFLQYMWLVVAVVSFCFAIYKMIFVGLGDGLFFMFFAAMATLLFYVRKRQLKRFENMSK